MNRGSEWHKWNFHVHTKGTNKNDQFQSSLMDEFFQTFFRKAIENEISAIGITDYFSIEKYLETVKYRDGIESKVTEEGEPIFSEEEQKLIKQIFLFPNVELRMIPSTDKGKLINIHCLFNPEYVDQLEHDFFSNIENQDGFQMNRHGITNYGISLDDSIQETHKQYEKGLDNFVVDITALKKILSKNKKFKDNTLLVVSNSNKDGASAIQKHYELFEQENGSLDGLRKSIYFISNAIFSTREKDINYFIGKRLEGTEGYNSSIYLQEVSKVIKERGSLKPCITGCDAHKEEDLFNRFTWVKSNLDFEGLKQICLEPEHRVRIQTDKPDFKEAKYLIDSVKFTCSDNTFSTEPILLNPNLNVIIGGKSSGKSILLYSLAKTLLADSNVLQNEDGTFKYDLDKIANDFDFEINTRGGFKQNLQRDEEENSILPEIKYIPQNYLVKLAEPQLNKKGRSLNKIVRDLITEDDQSKEEYNEFIGKVKQIDKLRNNEIENYFDVLKEIESIELELKTKSNKSVLEQNIASNSKKVEELNKSAGLDSEEIDKYKELQSREESIETDKESWKSDYLSVKNFNTELIQSTKSLKQKKDSLIQNIKTPILKEHYENTYSIIDQLLEKVLDADKEFETETRDDGKSYFLLQSELAKVLYTLNANLREVKTSIEPFLKNEKIKTAIEDLNKSIATDRKSLNDIETLTKKLTSKKDLIKKSQDDLFKIYSGTYKEYIEIIKSLKNRTLDLEKDGLKIEGKVKFNFPKLRKSLLSVSDGRTASYNNYNLLSESNKATSDFEFDQILVTLKQLFKDITEGNYALSKNANRISVLKDLLNDYFFDYWSIHYKNDTLGEMSTGKASFVILMLIIGLSKSKAPILIDQPEDNLDNRSITSDLVSYLRNKKLERQIIVVTHNANIVVNADAENIIVANQKGQNDDSSSSDFKFDYANGALENTFEKIDSETDVLKSMGIRQHVADIVEGGKDAFMKREKKYRFS
ncbi:hypothetical protein V6R21_06490 [Limibacter armeniacum]|uniref:TrlF family AAA-like ATPase n=1 Tax=Limibacter armeniacum TaxID=466084 RepID=UPI002FE697FE